MKQTNQHFPLLLQCNGKNRALGVDAGHVRLTATLDEQSDLQMPDFDPNDAVLHLYCEADMLQHQCPMPLCGMVWQVRPDAAWLPQQGKVFFYVTFACNGILYQSPVASFTVLPPLVQGKWIKSPKPDKSVLCFEKKFALTQAPQQAYLYLSALSGCSVTLNGHEIYHTTAGIVTNYGQRPTLPDSGSRIAITTLDVATQLQTGENNLCILLAPGYFENRDREDTYPDYAWGDAALFFELHTDGAVAAVSDTDCTVCGTNICSSLYCGDRVDFRPSQKKKQPPSLAPAPGGAGTDDCGLCPDQEIKTYRPHILQRSPGAILLDFGENHTGGLDFIARGNAGDVITVTYAERLWEDGTLNTDTGAWHGWNDKSGNRIDILQEGHYTLSGEADHIKPQFHWDCYRYALLSFPVTTEILTETIVSRFICSAYPNSGTFSCSDQTLEKLNRLFVQTLYCNLHAGLISDCPHREKLPYTGDGRLIQMAATYSLSGMLLFYEKWLIDICHSQQPDGMIPYSAPYMGGGGGYAWSNALCAVSETLFCLTGDKRYAEIAYKPICRLIDCYASHCDEKHIVRSAAHDWLLGDWLAPDMVQSDVYYISTVCYLRCVRTAKAFAASLCPGDVPALCRLEATLIGALQSVFFHPDSCTFGNGVQGETVLALAFGLVPPDKIVATEQQVRLHYTEVTDFHLDTGIVLTPILLQYLTTHHMADVALRLMTQLSTPSYAAMMTDESTLPEHWSGHWPAYAIDAAGTQIVPAGGELSHCHPMYGSTVAWLYERIGGLDLSEIGSNNRILFSPAIPGFLSHAAASVPLPTGIAAIRWSTAPGTLLVSLHIPRGYTGEVRFVPAQQYTAMTCHSDDSKAIPLKIGTDGTVSVTLSAGTWHINGTN